MSKTIVILADGMADEPIPELDGKTPVEYAATPEMDRIARDGACGTLLTLPDGYPTSSDVANMSVLGYDPAKHYTGRGPLEAISQGIAMGPNDIAWRCNLVTVKDNILVDYSGGHISENKAQQIINDLNSEFKCEDFAFYPGVSYRNILMLTGTQFSDQVAYHKPDASQGRNVDEILLKAAQPSRESEQTAEYLNNLMQCTRLFLESHPVNADSVEPANMIWLWSPGRQPRLPSFSEKYNGVRGAIISAVDVIFGLGRCAGMDTIKVDGATGFIDTNYEGKADAAVEALEKYDFVYVHVEAPDECSHMGDLNLKIQAIEDIDRRVIARIREQLGGTDVTYAVLPDHPVPIRLRDHTRDPVPFAISGSHIPKDNCKTYSERVASDGALGFLKGDQFMKRVLNIT